MENKKVIISICLKIVIVILAFLGIAFNIFTKGEYMIGRLSFLFFTIQSNFLIAIVALFLIVFDILKLKGVKKDLPRWLSYLKFAATSAISLTFIVFWTLLAWVMKPSYLYSVSNLTLHTFVPIIAVIDYILFTIDYKTTKFGLASSLIFPLAYFVFAVILIAFEVSFGPDMQAPYFFLDYKKNGWFKISNGQIGVFYWVMLILIIFYVIAFGIDKVHKMVIQKNTLKGEDV